MEKATALSAQQTTDSWSCLVRAGHRYGIRTTWHKAPTVHAKHKPHIPYLDAVDMLTFNAGPFPYGATKGSLQKFFGEWQWSARAVQPKGRSPDGNGVVWEIRHPKDVTNWVVVSTILYFHPYLGKIPILTNFFRWVETTN